MKHMKMCSIEGCDKRSACKSLCKTHYSRWYRHGDPMVRKNTPKGDACRVEGCDRPQRGEQLCGGHLQRKVRWSDVRADVPLRPAYTHDRVKNDQGYARVKVPGHSRGGRYGWVLEHIVVMERQLGRGLLPGEQVHHINGVRDDNRPENLELWVVNQPPGQRPADLVGWAREILARYEDEVDHALPANVGGAALQLGVSGR